MISKKQSNIQLLRNKQFKKTYIEIQKKNPEMNRSPEVESRKQNLPKSNVRSQRSI